MSEGPTRDPRDVLVVSCDIVGHSSELKHDVQLDRVVGINSVVAETMGKSAEAIWASGGDGGHVILADEDGAGALELITSYLRWSGAAGVGLRITAHAGEVSLVTGADGRDQVVGNGINVAGWLLSRGGPAGVIVSEAFRRRLHEIDGVEFHEPRILRDKRGVDQKLWRMSVGDFPSQWYSPSDGDREQLHAALELRRADPGWEHRGWEVMYYAKRILQVNKSDRDALHALDKLRQIHLMYTTPDGDQEANPFFEFLEPTMLREVIQSAQLVERQYNDVICRSGDEGDTMFVILRGRVGVYKMRARDRARPIEPHFSHQEGDVVGELAFALGRHRTADLVALTPVVLLSFHYRDIERHLDELESRFGDRAAQRARDAIQSFISRRVLEYVSQDVEFLVGENNSGPLAPDAIAALSNHTELIPMSSVSRLTFDEAVRASRKQELRHGIYLLADGDVSSQVAPGFTLSDADFPVLWVDVPGFFVMPKQPFEAQSDTIAVFRIEAGGIMKLERSRRAALRRSVLRAAARSCFPYDVFVAYTSEDADEATKWAMELRNRGLRVFMDVPVSGAGFMQAVSNGIKHSLAMVPLITPNVLIRDHADNWVVREINARERCFPEDPHILPVVFGDVRHQEIASGVTPIRVGAGRQEAIDELVDKVRALKSGLVTPPHWESEVADPLLE